MNNTINVRCRIVGLGTDGIGYRIVTSEEARKLLEGCFNSYDKSQAAKEPFNEVKLSINYDNCSLRELHNDLFKAFSLDISIPALIDEDMLRGWPELIIETKEKYILSIENENVLLKSLVERFNLTEIESYLVIFLGRGDFLRKGGFRFYFYSHEGNRHNRPHVHVETSDHREGTIDILTLEQNKGGKLKKHELSKIQKILKGKQIDLIKAWNLMTDGIHVDLDILLEQANLH